MPATGALAPILERKVDEAAALRGDAASLWARARAAAPPRPFAPMLRGGTLIAEMKRRSPSGGSLRPDLDCAAVARAYAAGGAAALSVLTDGPAFGGSLHDLATARAACPLPVLRKDFVVDAVQVAQTRAAGADCVLLIAAALDDATLAACLEAAASLSLDALVEVHDQAEARRALSAGARLVGVNNRDLHTLRTDLATFGRVAGVLVGAGCTVVAESGVGGPDDAAMLVEQGADAVLVGEWLLRQPDPGAACAEMVTALGGVPR